MKKIVIILLCVVLTVSGLSVGALAVDTVSTAGLITEWFNSAVKYASLNEYDSFASLYGDITQDDIKSEFGYFRDTVYAKKYKCSFNVVSDRESGQAVVDVMYYKKQSDGKGTIKYQWQTDVMYFGRYQGKAVRIPSNAYLRDDYNKYGKSAQFINSDSWVKHNSGIISRCTPAVKYARLNADSSITLTISVVNRHNVEVKVFCLSDYDKKSTITFGKYKFNITDCIWKKTIPAITVKNYKVTILASRVPSGITADDIAKCSYKFHYSYWSGDALYSGCIKG